MENRIRNSRFRNLCQVFHVEFRREATSFSLMPTIVSLFDLEVFDSWLSYRR